MSASWLNPVVTKVSKIHPLRTMNVCTKFYSNPSNGYCKKQVKAKHGNLVMALELKPGVTKVREVRPLRTMTVCAKFYGGPCKSC